MSNKRVILMADLVVKTHLQRKESEDLVASIPYKYLNDAIKTYKEDGVYGFILFVKAINL